MFTYSHRNWQGLACDVKIRGAHIMSIESVHVIRQGSNKYAIAYGLQVSEGLTYSAAAEELGRCLFHQLTCNHAI